MIFNIQRYSTHDGSGVRTNIFFKGCPLRCSWCSNPEGQSFGSEILFDEKICKNFGDCFRVNEDTISPDNRKSSPGKNRKAIRRQDGKLTIERSLIDDPDVLRDVCPSKALVVSGRNYTINELIHEIEKDALFYKADKGGVTLTGGEPFSHGKTLFYLLPELKKRGIHVSVETSLHVPWKKIEPHLLWIDQILADLKHTDPVKFEDFTGGNSGLVLDNFRRLDRSGTPFIVRVPVIPSFNFTWDELTGIIDYATSLDNCREIHLIPFHNLGKEKYNMLGRDYPFENIRALNENDLVPLKEHLTARGITTTIGG